MSRTNAIFFLSRMLTIIVFVFIFLRLFQLTVPISELLEDTYDYGALEKSFNSSQYRKEVDPGWIPDEIAYRYAGGYYLYGGDPILVIPEQPPLGKYFISLSILAFSNTRFVVFAFFYFTFFTIYILSRDVFDNALFAGSIVLAMLFEPLMVNQLVYVPLLDVMQLPFIVLSLHFFIKWIRSASRNDNIFYLASISLCIGMMVSIKFFITGLVVCVAFIVYLTLNRYFRKLMHFILALGVGAYSVLSVSYIRTLINNPDVFSVIKIQKWILWYHSSKLTSLFSIWPLIYLNQWKTWWGDADVIRDAVWWFGWPVVFTGAWASSIYAAVLSVKRVIGMKASRIQDSVKILVIWFLLYAGLLSLSQASSRYLIPVLPTVYILTAYGIVVAVSRFTKVYR